jgi:hypothetical protein
MKRMLPFAILILLTLPDASHARSCIRHAWETMEVELIEVTSEGKVVEPPSALEPLDHLINSSEMGEWVLFNEEATMGFGKFYKLDEEVEATGEVAKYLALVSTWQLRTGCKYNVRYTPIVPGRYVFAEEHSGGGTVSKGIDEPVLHVSPDRSIVKLDFSVGGTAYTAHYKVSCAYFEWTGEPKSCVDYSAAAKSPPPTPPLRPYGRLGCAGCTMSPGEPAAWWIALWLIPLVFLRRTRP